MLRTQWELLRRQCPSDPKCLLEVAAPFAGEVMVRAFDFEVKNCWACGPAGGGLGRRR